MSIDGSEKYARERSNFILLVDGRPIGMGEELVYDSQEHAIGAAIRLNLAVPINIWQTCRYQSSVCETIQPDPQLEKYRKVQPKSIWQMYLLGWKLTMVELVCSQPVPAAYREGYLYVQVEKPEQGSMDKNEPYRPIGTTDNWFALWPWFQDWAKASADTLADCSWVLRTEAGESRGKLLFA